MDIDATRTLKRAHSQIEQAPDNADEWELKAFAPENLVMQGAEAVRRSVSSSLGSLVLMSRDFLAFLIWGAQPLSRSDFPRNIVTQIWMPN